MVIIDGCDAVFNDFRCDRLRRQLHSIHSVDQSLEALVCQWRLTTIEFYNPFGQKKKKICVTINPDINLKSTM